MQFFPSDPTPFDLFMLFMSYGVGIPACIYAGIIWYRIKKARWDKEREREEFRKEFRRENKLKRAEKEAEQSTNR